MPAPFYNAIKGTTAGTPGTGAFTPNAAAPKCRAWSKVPAGWMGLVCFEDGSAAEWTFCYWNGTTLSRSATQFFDSTTGSPLSLTSAATAALVADANELQPSLGGVPWMGWVPLPTQSSTPNFGIPPPTTTGTTASRVIDNTNFISTQPRYQLTSATTANAQAGFTSAIALLVYSTTAGRGGGQMVSRWGFTQLPTGPRWFCGLTTVTMVGVTSEPSALVASAAAFIKDSTDTNIQFYTNDNSGGGNKTDTGIPIVANGWYESAVWFDSGGGRVCGLLMRLDTGDIWFGSTTTQLPANGAALMPQQIGGLSATTGTAIVLNSGGYSVIGGG